MYLCIDAGNTRTKTAVFDANGSLVYSSLHTEYSMQPILEQIATYSIEHFIVSATGSHNLDLEHIAVAGLKIELNHQTPLPVQIVYTTPETLGRDRIAAACGAHALYPGKNCVVIDAGTCVTMDIQLGSGAYLGGNIAPGLKMRLKAMHAYTARLPLVEPSWPDLEFGNSTMHALQNGAALGILMEIEGYLQRARNAFGEVFIVMTGGDADFFAGKIESQIFVEPELVAHGLFQILAFNVQKHN